MANHIGNQSLYPQQYLNDDPEFVVYVPNVHY